MIEGDYMPIPNKPAFDVIELTRQLVSILSFVDKQHNETALVDYLEKFFASNLPTLKTERQYIDSSRNRANLVIKGRGKPKLFVLGHIDTVQPTDNWSTDPLTPVVRDNRLYGLGAADMKGSLAAFLCALIETDSTLLDNMMILLYVDEEYDFAGMRRFLEDNTLNRTPPELIISLDGALDLLSGCRGLIEFSARIKGKSGHSSNPNNGLNVITRTVDAIQNLEVQLHEFNDAQLGDSTLNVAYLQGGVIENQNGQDQWLREGNVIPDTADVVLEFRTAHRDLDAIKARDLFVREIEEQKLSVDSITVRHNYGLWPVSYDSRMMSFLEQCYEDAGLAFQKSDRSKSGFIDVQMITEVITAPTYVIGAGGENKHGANESVDIEDLTKAKDIYKVILINS